MALLPMARPPRFSAATLLVAVAFAGTLALLVAVTISAEVKGLSFGYFSREPATVTNVHWFVGFLSQVSVLVLWSGAVAAVLCAALAWQMGHKQRAEALVVTGVIMAWLAIDDAFQFHEVVIPRYLRVPEEGVYGAYVLAGVVYVRRYWWFLRTGPWPLLLLGAALLGAMAATDLATQQMGIHLSMLEDGTKLFGVVSLTSFVIWSSLRAAVRQ